MQGRSSREVHGEFSYKGFVFNFISNKTMDKYGKEEVVGLVEMHANSTGPSLTTS